MKKARKQKRKAPKARPKLEMLPPPASVPAPPWLIPANLIRRGELEGTLSDLRDELFRYVIERTSGAHDAEQKTKRAIEQMQIAVREVRGLLGIDRTFAACAGARRTGAVVVFPCVDRADQ